MKIRFEKRAGTDTLYCRMLVATDTEIRFSTGIKCLGKFFKISQRAHLPGGKSDVELNARLDVLAEKYVAFVADYMERYGSIPSPKEVASLTADVRGRLVPLQRMMMEDYLPTIENEFSHRSIRSSIRQYAEYTEDVQSEIIPEKMKSRVKMGMTDGLTDEVHQHFVGYRNWMIKQGCGNRTVKTRLSHIGLAYRHVIKGADYMPNWRAVEPRVEVHDDDVIAFDSAFVESFKERYAYERPLMDPELQQAYDYGIIAIVTGWRHQSIVAITEDNLAETEHGLMLKSVSDKTNRTQVARVTPVLEAALNNSLQMNGTLSPRVVPSTINRRLQALLKHLGYTKMLSYARNTTGGKKAVISKPMYEWVSPHTLRRTAMTYYLKQGMDQRVVKNIGGFAPNSTSFSRYASYTEKDVLEAMEGIK